MQLEAYLEFLGPDQIRLAGHRIGIEHVVELYREGASPERIALTFPGLSLEQIYATITYYLHNQAEIDAYMQRQLVQMRREMAAADAQAPSPAMQRIRTLQVEREQARAGA